MEPSAESLAIRKLLDSIYETYGYDFREYAEPSIARRIRHRLTSSGLASIDEIERRVLADHAFFLTVLRDFTVGTTEMFRDPSYYRALKKTVIPILRTYPSLTVWCPGCSTGEEVYSLAILFLEEGILKQTQIYATDLNPGYVEKAREGEFRTARLASYQKNYAEAGGLAHLEDYFDVERRVMTIRPWLKQNIVFSPHNLAIDASFQEMHLVVCRNVLIYMNRNLRRRVISLLKSSLCRRGFLCLGNKESLLFSGLEAQFEPWSTDDAIYRLK